MPQTARRYVEIEVEAAQALRALRGIEEASKGTETAITGLQKQFSSMGEAFRGFLGFLGAQQLVGFADAAADLEQRLQATTSTIRESEEVFEELLAITGRLGVGIVELGRSFAQLAVALPGRTADEIIEALDTVSTVLATTGATTQQVNAVLLQLNQALSSNVLQGDEFKSVFENAPVLLQAWRQAADLTEISLRELSATGQLTTESFFRLLPEIREIAVTMIGMEQPALTVARAFEILRSNVIALFKDSDSVSIAMTAVSTAIVAAAENLDLLVTAAVAFAALKLPSYLGLVAAGVALTSASFAALFAVFQAWDWAVDRIQEAARSMDLLAEEAEAAAKETKEFVETFEKLRKLDADSASVFELEEGLGTATQTTRQLYREIAEVRLELDKLTDDQGRVSAFAQYFDPTTVARVDFLRQKLLLLEKQLEVAEEAAFDLSVSVDSIDRAAQKAAPSFEELTSELDAITQIRTRTLRQRFRVEAQLELVGLEGIEKIRAQVAQSFDQIIRQSGIEISQALVQLSRLQEALDFADTEEEFEKLTKEIDKQNAVVDENVRLIRAVQAVRAEEEESLVRQTFALEQAQVAAQKRAEAIEENVERMRDLAEVLTETERAASSAEGALRAFQRGGEAGLATFERQRRLQEAFNEALQQQGTTFRNASLGQIANAFAVTEALRRQLRAQDELNRAQRQSRDIQAAQARVETIGVDVVGEIREFGDIRRIVDDIRSQAIDGNLEAAQALFDVAEQGLRRLAEEIEGPYTERQFERARDALRRAAEVAFRRPELPPEVDVINAQIAAAAELTVPTLVAPVVVDQESLDTAVVDMQERLAAADFRIQVTPELVGLAIDNVVAETVDQEGAALS